MKPALYFTLVPGWSPKSAYRVMTVTSEKPDRMIYGRDDQDCSTHRHWRDRHGRFETEAAAKAVISQIIDVHDRFADKLRAARLQLKAIDQAEREAVRDVLRDAKALI